MENKQREKKKESELNETNRAILQKIKAIKAKHPLWDYRRVTAWLRHREFMIEGLGWAYLVIVLDWFTKEIVGFDISLRSKTENWLKALEMGLNKKFEAGVVLNQLQGRL